MSRFCLACLLSLVVLVSYHYLLRFSVLSCVLLALRCLLWSLCVLTSLCSLIAVSFFLLALAPSLCSTWSSLSPSLAVALLLVSGFSSQYLLVYLSLVSLLVNLLCPFFMLGGPGLSLRPSRVSLASLTFLLISLFWYIWATFSAHPWSRISCQCKYT